MAQWFRFYLETQADVGSISNGELQQIIFWLILFIRNSLDKQTHTHET